VCVHACTRAFVLNNQSRKINIPVCDVCFFFMINAWARTQFCTATSSVWMGHHRMWPRSLQGCSGVVMDVVPQPRKWFDCLQLILDLYDRNARESIE